MAARHPSPTLEALLSLETPLIIAGPTASGKSSLALRIAEQSGAHIINADSIQVYEGLPLLTATPSAASKERVPHHLYGILSPDHPSLSAVSWATSALSCLREAKDRGIPTLIVGGTGFYLRALTEGFSPIPSVPDTVREEVQNRPLETLYRELQSIDPVIAERLSPQDRSRITRAMEVYTATGVPLSLWQSHPRQKPPETFRTCLLLPEDSPQGRRTLHRRIAHRLQTMWHDGVVEEVCAFQRNLDIRGLATSPATRALGYHAILEFGQGLCSREEAIDKTLTATNQYAKRQCTWFRHQLIPDVHLVCGEDFE